MAGVSTVGVLDGKSCKELAPLNEAVLTTFLILRFEILGLVGEECVPGGMFEGGAKAVDDIMLEARTSFLGLNSFYSSLQLLFVSFENS